MYRTHVREFGAKCLIQELRQSKNVLQRTHARLERILNKLHHSWWEVSDRKS